MPRRRARVGRLHKLIGAKVFHDTDRDILEWWEGIPLSDRSGQLKALIRAHLGQQSEASRLAAIERALIDLKNQVATLAVRGVVVAQAAATDGLTNDDLEKRKAKMLQRKW